MRGLTHHSRRDPRECEKCRAEVLGTFSARAHRECREQCGECVCGRHALRAGRQVSSANATPCSAPVHKKDMTRDSCCTPHLHHILCSAHMYTRATARRDSFHFISFHFISFHFISFHFISFHFISFHFISFHFISFHFISFHFISFHFISFHFISFSFHFISFTCRHKATAPQATHVHMTVYVSCRAVCAVARVCTVRSLRVCACGVWAHFFAQGELTRPSASSGAHRPRSTLAVHGCVLDPEGGGRWKVEVR